MNLFHKLGGHFLETQLQLWHCSLGKVMSQLALWHTMSSPNTRGGDDDEIEKILSMQNLHPNLRQTTKTTNVDARASLDNP